MELLRAKTSWITPKVIRIPNSLLLDRWHGARENAATSSDFTWVSMAHIPADCIYLAVLGVWLWLQVARQVSVEVLQ